MTSDKANTVWHTDEFGAVTPTVTVLLAIYFWSRRKELAWPPRRGVHKMNGAKLRGSTA